MLWYCSQCITWDMFRKFCSVEYFFLIFYMWTDLMKKIGKTASEYLGKVRHMSPEKRTSQLNQIESMFSKSREFGDDKVSLAMQTYEMVCSFYTFFFAFDLDWFFLQMFRFFILVYIIILQFVEHLSYIFSYQIPQWWWDVCLCTFRGMILTPPPKKKIQLKWAVIYHLWNLEARKKFLKKNNNLSFLFGHSSALSIPMLILDCPNSINDIWHVWTKIR